MNNLSKKMNDKGDGLMEMVVDVSRNTAVTKGGRKFSFAAVVVVGNGKGRVGIARKKGADLSSAIQKAFQYARKNLHQIQLNNDTVLHSFISTHGASKVLVKPGSEGTGIIAGGAMRSLFAVAGIKNVLAKCIKSSNKHNVLIATLNGLLKMKTPESIAAKRNKEVAEIISKEK